MYEFPKAEFAMTSINIPWMVSRGYLVFTPDVYYSTGKAGESVRNSVVAAAQYLSTMPWVDASRMGITGQSFGGYETQYLVANTQLFAAAVGTSGFCNMVNFYGGTLGKIIGDLYGQTYSEAGQFSMGATLWERPDLYIENSPVFKLNQANYSYINYEQPGRSHSTLDTRSRIFYWSSPVRQKAWMLQYDEGGHGAHLDKDARDYTIRSTQFFDLLP